MSLAYACNGCGRVTEVPEHCAGKRVRCKNCGVEGRIPTAAGPSGAAAPRRPEAPMPDGVIAFACAACGRDYRVAPDLAGRTVRCKDCGAPVSIPGAAAPVDVSIYGLADAGPAPVSRRSSASVVGGSSLERSPAGQAPRARRSRWLADATDHDDILNKMCFYGAAVVVGGFVVWLLAMNGIALRSRAARLMNRPADLGGQAVVGLGMMAVGALSVFAACAGAGVRLVVRRELPTVSALGLVGWVVSLPIAVVLPTIVLTHQGAPGP